MIVSVITVSDRVSEGTYEDRSGPEIERILREALPDAEIVRSVVPDEADRILAELEKHADADFIFTSGGTGISPRDVTPEVTGQFCERSLPGVAEMLRTESYKETRNAVFSRGFAGTRGTTIVVNFPGSVKAARLCTTLLAPLMNHAMRMVRGEGH